jgi:hypothetical protein
MYGFLSLVKRFGFLLVTFCVGPGITFAQTTFERTYVVDEDAQGRSVQQTSDGGYIIVGCAKPHLAGGNADVLLIKLNCFGDTVWTRRYGGSNEDEGHSVQQTSDGGYIIAGSTGGRLFLVKTDSAGNSLWTKVCEGGTVGRSVRQTNDGGYIVGGTLSKVQDMYLVKTNTLGDTLWTRAFSGPDNDEGYSVQQTSDGGYILAGYTHINRAAHWETDVYLVKTDSSGNTLWARTYGGTDWDRGASVQQTSDNGYVIVGSTQGDGYTSPTHLDIFLVKTNASGDTLWTRTYSSSQVSADAGNSVQQTTDGGYIIAGFEKLSEARGQERMYIVKTDSSGERCWHRTYRPMRKGYAYSVQQTSDGGYVIAGETTSLLDTKVSPDVCVVKTRSDGLLDMPDVPMLSQPYDGARGAPTSPTLSWLWPLRAYTFRIQVARDSLFAELVVDDSLVYNNHYWLSQLPTNTQHYWRVNATNPGGTREYSGIWSFRTVVANPMLEAPSNGATSQSTTLTLTWHRSVGASQYRIQLGLDSTFANGVFLDDSTLVDTSRMVSGLATGTRYFWRVCAMDAGAASTWSLLWTFGTKLGMPAPVTLVFPADKATVSKDSVRFLWRPGVPSVEHYRWELSMDSLFHSSTIDSLLTDTSKVVRELTGAATYWWKVSAENASGWGAFSPGNRFATLATGVCELREIPLQFNMSLNYPNPFNPNTTIRYELPKSSVVRLSVYDMLGREVAVLVNERKDAGSYEIKLEGHNLASGVYLYRLIAGDFVQTRQMLVIK